MDDLVDCKILNNENENEKDQLNEFALYIQKNSRLKLILLADCPTTTGNLLENAGDKEWKLDNIIKIVRFLICVISITY